MPPPIVALVVLACAALAAVAGLAPVPLGAVTPPPAKYYDPLP